MPRYPLFLLKNTIGNLTRLMHIFFQLYHSFRTMKYAKVCVFGYSDSTATRMVSSGKNVKDLLHIEIGGGCCFLKIAAALTRAHIGRIPVPPAMLDVRLLKVLMVLCRLME